MKIKIGFYLTIFTVLFVTLISSSAKNMEGDESIFEIDTTRIKENIENYSQKIENAIGMGIIGRARENLRQLNQTIDVHKKIFTKDIRKELIQKAEKYEADILKAEDALVAIADSLIDHFKLMEAKNFLQKKLILVGIDPEKIQKVEQNLLKAEND